MMFTDKELKDYKEGHYHRFIDRKDCLICDLLARLDAAEKVCGEARILLCRGFISEFDSLYEAWLKSKGIGE